MMTSLKFALLLGVVTVFSGAAPAAAPTAKVPEGPLQGVERGSERPSDRLQREFDRNKDGRVSHDEMNRTLGARFAFATRHAPKMTMDQFLEVRAETFRQSNEATFRRLDWNSDGKLTAGEFAAPQRIRFVSLDRGGAGVVSCAFADNRGSGRGGVSRFCTDNDLDMDGRVTRSELDTSISKRFARATAGAQTMSNAQFAVSEQQRFATTNARTFRRLDADGDGLLTIGEFAASELKLFARLDKNNDGVLAPGEMRQHYARSSRNARRAY